MGVFMRKILLTVALVLTTGSAMASSIEVIHGSRTGNDSVVNASCASCPPLKTKVDATGAPSSLQPGTQDISIRDVNGKKQIVRTEAWLGGSPVTYVSNNQTWLPAEDAGTALAEKAPVVDAATKTAAVEPVITSAGIAPVTAGVTAPLALEGLSLRQSQ
jgi:hypothetical protein